MTIDGRDLVRGLLTHLECTNCGATYPIDRLMTTCPACAKVLFARYDLDAAARLMTPQALTTRPWDFRRYAEILPIQEPESAPSLGEGGTPLHEAPRLARAFGCERLLIKDEGLNPTGSFKARGLAMAVARARELGATTVAIPSAGNAAAAMAAYAARAGMRAVVAMPSDVPPTMKAECLAYGAHVLLVDGLIDDCGKVIRAGAAAYGWCDVSTLREPYRAEGKKTMGLEIAEQLGWRMPDVILYPTGGGVGLIGIHKALVEARELGWVAGELPRLVCVQATGCAPIVTAYDAGQEESVRVEDSSTVAFGINVPKALGDFLVLRAVRETGGTAVAVEDADLLADLALTARLEGLFLCPEGAATVTAARQLARTGWLSPDDEVVLLNTGAGVIYPDTVTVDAPTIAKDGVLVL